MREATIPPMARALIAATSRVYTQAMVIGASSLVLSLSALAAGGTPPEARGKSVVVTWTEDRVQRFLGTDGQRQVHADISMTAYVSTAGRIFNRITIQVIGRRGGVGSVDQVAGSEGARRVTRFEGRTLLIDTEFRGSARRIAVDFDAGFASCNARVINGNERGASTNVRRSIVNGELIEILSMTTSPAQCFVKEGNAFGG